MTVDPRDEHGIITDPAKLAAAIEADDGFDPSGHNFSLQFHRAELAVITEALREHAARRLLVDKINFTQSILKAKGKPKT